MNKIIIGLVLLMLKCTSGFAQCNDAMYNRTLAKAGKDIVLVRDFKIKLNEGSKRNPSPVIRYSVIMQKGLTYRFIISRDSVAQIEPILQLFDRNEFLGTTFERTNNINLEQFDYKCTRTGNYKVLISINNAKAGCGIGVMAMVTDSAYYSQGKEKPIDERYTLYTGIENALNIASDQPSVKKVSVTSDRGTIKEQDSVWYIQIPTTGLVKINVKLFNSKDSIIEEVDQEFNVISPPKPEVSIEGTIQDYINSSWIGLSTKLIVKPSIYKIKQFDMSTDLSANFGFHAYNEYLTSEMITFIKLCNPLERIYIKNIQLIGPDGSVVDIEPLTYYVK